MKKITRTLVIASVLALVLAGCGRVVELVLDARWTIEEIKAGDVILTDVDDYLVVTFDADTETATMEVGPDWDTLSSVNVTGTFDYTISATDNVIVLSHDGVDEHVITYELEDGLERMVWTRWVAVGTDPEIEIVSDSATIDYIAFERQASS